MGIGLKLKIIYFRKYKHQTTSNNVKNFKCSYKVKITSKYNQESISYKSTVQIYHSTDLNNHILQNLYQQVGYDLHSNSKTLTIYILLCFLFSASALDCLYVNITF